MPANFIDELTQINNALGTPDNVARIVNYDPPNGGRETARVWPNAGNQNAYQASIAFLNNNQNNQPPSGVRPVTGGDA